MSAGLWIFAAGFVIVALMVTSTLEGLATLLPWFRKDRDRYAAQPVKALVSDLRLAAQTLIKDPAQAQVIVLPPPPFLTVEQHVWLTTYNAVAGCPNADGAAAQRWADRGLERFREKFR